MTLDRLRYELQAHVRRECDLPLEQCASCGRTLAIRAILDAAIDVAVIPFEGELSQARHEEAQIRFLKLLEEA